MFLLLSRVLLWLLVGTIIYTLFQRFYPSGNFIGRLLLVILFIVVLLSFFNPSEPAVASLWRVVSFPLKPLGAAILLMIFAAQRIAKDGGISAPGGYLIGWALTILLLASTPAFAYFLARTPVAMASDPTLAVRLDMLQNVRVSSIAPNVQNYETLVAFAQVNSGMSVSDIAGDGIITSGLADIRTAPYLMQAPTPTDIPRRGLRIEDFVPNAETLSLTTRVWESYLTYVSGFLRGR